MPVNDTLPTPETRVPDREATRHLTIAMVAVTGAGGAIGAALWWMTATLSRSWGNGALIVPVCGAPLAFAGGCAILVLAGRGRRRSARWVLAQVLAPLLALVAGFVLALEAVPR